MTMTMMRRFLLGHHPSSSSAAAARRFFVTKGRLSGPSSRIIIALQQEHDVSVSGRRRLFFGATDASTKSIHTTTSPYYRAATLPRLFPIKEIEIVSLGTSSSNDDDDDDEITGGRLAKIIHPVDSFVEAGDVVAEIATSTSSSMDSSSNSTGTTIPTMIQVQTPQAGKITEILRDINDSISVGDVLFRIDTDQQQVVPPPPAVEAQAQEQQQQQQQMHHHHPLLETTVAAAQELLIQHLRDNQGALTQDFVSELIASNDVERLLSMAKVMRSELLQLPNEVRVRALELLEHVLKLQQQQQPEQQEAIAITHMEMGLLNSKLAFFDAAVVHLERAIFLFKQQQQQQSAAAAATPAAAPTSTTTTTTTTTARRRAMAAAACHVHLATIARHRGDIQGAIQAFQQALAIQKEVVLATTEENNEHNDDGLAVAAVAATNNNLGAIHYEKGDFQKAIDYYKIAIEERNKLGGGEESDETGRAVMDMAGSYSNLAMALKQTGQLGDALINCQKSLQLRQQFYKKNDDPYHPDLAASHDAMGTILAELGQFEAALEQYHAACEVQEKAHNQDSSSSSPSVAMTYNKLGSVYYQMKDYDRALVEHRKALDILNQADAAASEATVPALIRDLANTYNHIGMVLLQRRHEDTNDLEEALVSHQTALQMLESIFGKDSPQLAVAVGSVGNCLEAQGKLDEALKTFRHAHELLVVSDNNSATLTSGQQEQPPKLSPDVAANHNQIGLILAKQGKFDDALVEYRAAKQVFSDVLGPNHPYTASCHFNAGLALSQQLNESGKSSDLSIAACEEFERAREIWASHFGDDHPQTQMAAEYVEKLSEPVKAN